MTAMTDKERAAYAALMVEARLKLQEAERAWHAAFVAAPAGDQRIFAGAVFERIRCATRSPF